jgi:hypothetical protein
MQIPHWSVPARSRSLNGFSLAATFEGEFSRDVTSYASKGLVRCAW